MSSAPILPFSKRTTALVTVFGCLFAAKNAQKLTSSAMTSAALRLSHAKLFQSYRLLAFQNTPNRADALDAAIAVAQTAIIGLNSIVSVMPEPTPLPENSFALSDIQAVVANAVQTIANVAASE